MKAFIDEHRGAYGVEPICKVMQIAPSTYWLHAQRRAQPALRPARMQRDDALKGHIERVWQDLHANVTRNHRCQTMEELMVQVKVYLRARNKRGRHCYPRAAAS